MSHWSPENAKLILNRLCEHPNVSAAGKLIGIPEGSKTIWAWARNSAADKANGITGSKYIITGWPDDDDRRPMFFFEAMELSRQIHALNLDAQAREDLNGLERPVIEGGRFQYVIDAKAVAEYDNKRDAETFGGYFDWPYAHDSEGARIVLTVKEHVPSQLRIQGLKALMGDIWNVAERKEIDTQISGGVMVLHGDANPPASAPKLSMRDDLEWRLQAIRERNAKLEPAAKKPEGEVAIFRDMRTQDQPDDVPDRAPQQLPAPTTLRDHPRAYEVPKLTPAQPRAAPSYAKPAPSLDTSFAGGRPKAKPPGGFRVDNK